MNEIKPVKHICFMLRVYVYWLQILSVDDVFFSRTIEKNTRQMGYMVKIKFI